MRPLSAAAAFSSAAILPALDQPRTKVARHRAVAGVRLAALQAPCTKALEPVLSSVNIRNPLPVKDTLLGRATHVGAHWRPQHHQLPPSWLTSRTCSVPI